MLVRLSAVVLLLLAPGIQAQATGPAIQVEIDAPTQPIQPGSESPLIVTVTLACPTVLAAQDPQDPQDGANVSVAVTITNGVVVTGAPFLLFPWTDCASGKTEATRSATLQISIPPTAPGLTPLAGTVKVSVGGAEQAVPFAITADYYSVNQVKLASRLKMCHGCSQIPFEMEITNLGNARTQYNFELVNKPSGKWNAELPSVLLVDAKNSGPGSATATAVLVVHPPSSGGEGGYQIIIKPSSADDPSKHGNPMTVNVLARDVTLASRATPAPALPLALAALAATLAPRRRP